MTIIKPVSDLQRNISSIYELAHETREPIYLTRNGEASLVLMDADAFDEALAIQHDVYEFEMFVKEGIERGEADYEAGRYRPWKEIKAEMGL